MRRRDFVRGLIGLGVTAAVADHLAFVQGLGRVFPSGEVPPETLAELMKRVYAEAFAGTIRVEGQSVLGGPWRTLATAPYSPNREVQMTDVMIPETMYVRVGWGL